MPPIDFAILAHLLSALVAGSLIGLERSYRGRAAGFRTHALVCLSSSLLMLLTAFQSTWLKDMPIDAFRTDPTRMAQGIMTGIGFLGAGVIYKDGFSVRGLTTAGSIWMTAAIGILFGIGFYFPAIVATVLSLLVLSVFRWVESRLPAETYSHLNVAFAREAAMTEIEISEFLRGQGFFVVSVNYQMKTASPHDGAIFEYNMVVRTHDSKKTSQLAQALLSQPRVRNFRLDPPSN